LRFPEGAILGDPVRGLVHGLRGEAETMDTAIDFAMKETGGFEDTEMFGDGGKRHPKGSGEFGDLGFAKSETSEDGTTRGIGEGAEGGIQGARIFNHKV
jgi:hypothetical protein